MAPRRGVEKPGRSEPIEFPKPRPKEQPQEAPRRKKKEPVPA